MVKVKEFPFIGRAPEIMHCMQLLEKASASDGPLRIFITGELGIGKSRFIKEVAR